MMTHVLSRPISPPNWIEIAATHPLTELAEIHAALRREYLSNEERYQLYMREEELGARPQGALELRLARAETPLPIAQLRGLTWCGTLLSAT